MNNTLTAMVRTLINDLSDSPEFEDWKVEQAIVTAGLLVSQEYTFDTEYTFDLEEYTITPDPASTAKYDAVAIALFTLKAACILNMGSYNSSLSGGIKIREGDAQVDTTGSFSGYSDIINNGPCKSYEKMLNKLHMGQTIGRAVMSPMIHPTDNPRAIRPFFDTFIRNINVRF